MKTYRGIALAEMIFGLSMASVIVMLAGIFINWTGLMTFPAWIAPACLVGIPTGFVITMLLFEGHPDLLRGLLRSFVPSFARRVKLVEETFRTLALSAVPEGALLVSNKFDVKVGLKVGFSVEIEPEQSHVIVHNPIGEGRAEFRFDPEQLDRLEKDLDDAFQEIMGPSLKRWAIYSWPFRCLECAVEFPSRHATLSALAQIRAQRT